MRVRLCAVFAALIIGGCSNEAPVNSSAANLDSATEISPQQPRYDDSEDGVYFYASDVSEEDKKKGKALGSVSGFRYLGRDASGRYKLGLVSDSGSIISRYACANPCKIIKNLGSGERIPFSSPSIIGAAFEDAINGLLKEAPKAAVVEEPKRSSITMATLKSSDWNKIGMGCACSFTVGKPIQEKLIAGGDGLAFLRLNGKDRLCPAPDIQTLFDGPVSMSCGSTAVQVTPFGKAEPGLDGHSSKARLNIADAAGTLSLTGAWECSC